MMKKNSERNAAIRFMKKLFILFIPFIALLAVYFWTTLSYPEEL